jgi:hypothetical protein
MKTALYTLLFSALALCIPTTAVFASTALPANAEQSIQNDNKAHAGKIDKSALKKQFKALKKQFKADKKNGTAMEDGAAIDFKDPVDKFLWFGLLGVAAAIVLSIISGPVFGFYWLAYLVWLAGVVCLTIWLLKKLEVID